VIVQLQEDISGMTWKSTQKAQLDKSVKQKHLKKKEEA
jgi:hypothetical protein